MKGTILEYIYTYLYLSISIYLSIYLIYIYIYIYIIYMYILSPLVASGVDHLYLVYTSKDTSFFCWEEISFWRWSSFSVLEICLNVGYVVIC